MRLRARCLSVCFPSFRAALSLIARSLLPPHAMMSSPPPRHGHDVIGRPAIEPIPPRRIITPRCLLPASAPFSSHVPIAPRLACFAPVIAPSPDVIAAVPSVRLLPHHLGIIISSSRLRVMLSPPLAPPLLVEERGGDTDRLRTACCSDVIALLLACPMPFPASDDLAVVISCGLAASHVPTVGRAVPYGRLACFPV